MPNSHPSFVAAFYIDSMYNLCTLKRLSPEPVEDAHWRGRRVQSGKPKKEKKEKRKSGDGEGEQEEEADSSDDEQLMLGVDASLLEREAARAEREARKARKKSKRAKQSRAERVERKPGSGGGGSSAVKKNAEQLKKEERERQKALQQAHDREMRLKFEAKQRERLVRACVFSLGSPGKACW
jgi:hypothetical protein